MCSPLSTVHSPTGRGLEVRLRGSDLSLSLVLSEAFATTVNGTPSSFDITGGGALYQLGPSVTFNQQTNVGIDSISASSLGGTLIDDGTGPVLQFLESLRSGGLNDLKSQNFSNAGAILESRDRRDLNFSRPPRCVRAEHPRHEHPFASGGAREHHFVGLRHPRHRFRQGNQRAHSRSDPHPGGYICPGDIEHHRAERAAAARLTSDKHADSSAWSQVR